MVAIGNNYEKALDLRRKLKKEKRIFAQGSEPGGGFSTIKKHNSLKVVEGNDERERRGPGGAGGSKKCKQRMDLQLRKKRGNYKRGQFQKTKRKGEFFRLTTRWGFLSRKTCNTGGLRSNL